MLSIQLKDPLVKQQPQGQDKMLHTKLRNLNIWIDQQVRPIQNLAHTSETKAKYSGGIIFPFDQGDDVDPWVILRNIPELAQIFETKVRSPFKVVFEVCRLSELKGQDLYTKHALTTGVKKQRTGNGGTGSADVLQMTEENQLDEHITTNNPFDIDSAPKELIEEANNLDVSSDWEDLT